MGGSLQKAWRITETVIDLREQGEIKSEAGRITVAPAWKWALR